MDLLDSPWMASSSEILHLEPGRHLACTQVVKLVLVHLVRAVLVPEDGTEHVLLEVVLRPDEV